MQCHDYHSEGLVWVGVRREWLREARMLQGGAKLSRGGEIEMVDYDIE